MSVGTNKRVEKGGVLVPERLVADHIAVQHHCLVGAVAQRLDFGLRERTGNRGGLGLHALQNALFGLSNHDASLLEDLRLVVIIDPEAGEQDFVFVGTQRAVQNLLCRGGCLVSSQNQRPEAGVVQVVDVSVRLSPRNVIANVLQVIAASGKQYLKRGINDDAAIETRRILQGCLHKLRPVEDIHRRELGNDGGENLGFPPVEKRGFPFENERVLVAFSNRQDAVSVGLDNLSSHLDMTRTYLNTLYS